jgi:hypothetical protein
LRAEDPDFKAASKEMFARSPYEIAANHELATVDDSRSRKFIGSNWDVLLD